MRGSVAGIAAQSDPSRLRAAADRLLPLPYDAWHFGDSVAFEALVAASDALGDRGYLEFARGFVRAWEVTRDGHRPLDCTAAGLAMCQIHERTGDTLVLDSAASLAAYLAQRPRIEGVFETWSRSPLRRPYGPDPLDAEGAELLADPGPGVFLDCLHFEPPLFAALGALTGDLQWSELALDQALGYVRLLQDADTGLFHHFFLERTSRAYIADWGRGQGWALLGLLAVVEHLPSSRDRAILELSVRRLCEAMERTQRADGHWNAAVEDAVSGVETSTACFMAVGMARAANLGLAEFSAGKGAQRAHDAAVSAMDSEGLLRGVSAEVWASTLPSHYAHVPRDFVVPWGQGPLVLMLAQSLRSRAGEDGAR